VPIFAPIMRTLGFRTHVLLAVAAAIGLIASLSRPWYAAAPATVSDGDKVIGDIYGPLDGFFRGVERWVTDPAGTAGWEALDQWAVAVAVMAAVAAVGALACMLPPLQGAARELLRYAALAAFAIAVWKLLDPPGSNGASELRYGAFAGVGCAIMLLTCGMGVANAPSRRRVRPAPFTPLPPPQSAYESSGSSGPPGL
jgi:hypothetical protein